MSKRTRSLTAVFILLSAFLTLSTSAQNRVGDFQKRFIATPDTFIHRYETMPVIAIMVSFSDRRNTLSREAVWDVIFGDKPSVTGFYRATSQGKFTFIPAEARQTPQVGSPGVFGWYQLAMTRAEFDDLSSGQKRAATIEAAGNELRNRLDLKEIDRNGNKRIEQDELAIVMVWAGCDRNAEAVRFPDPARVNVGDGYSISQAIAANYEGALTIGGRCRDPEVNPNRIAHSLGHSVFGLGDQYEGTIQCNPNNVSNQCVPNSCRQRGNGQFRCFNRNVEAICNHSLMANDWALVADRGVPDLDPWVRLQLGWMDARIATGGNQGSTCYRLSSAERSGSALIIPIYGKGTKEYFVVENRFPEGTYQGGERAGAQGIDRGLAIWHINENMVNNPGAQPDPLGRMPTINHRQAIRLMRAQGPVPAGQCKFVSDGRAFFDASVPEDSYPVTGSSAPRNSRTWAGEKTGIQISMLSAPGEEVLVKVRNPFHLITTRRVSLQNQIDGRVTKRDALFDQLVNDPSVTPRIDELNGELGDLIRKRNTLARETIETFSAKVQTGTCP